jgi:hypothetical protein
MRKSSKSNLLRALGLAGSVSLSSLTSGCLGPAPDFDPFFLSFVADASAANHLNAGNFQTARGMQAAGTLLNAYGHSEIYNNQNNQPNIGSMVMGDDPRIDRKGALATNAHLKFLEGIAIRDYCIAGKSFVNLDDMEYISPNEVREVSDTFEAGKPIVFCIMAVNFPNFGDSPVTYQISYQPEGGQWEYVLNQERSLIKRQVDGASKVWTPPRKGTIIMRILKPYDQYTWNIGPMQKTLTVK